MKKRTKALLITSSFLPGRGGIERYLAGLCDQLAPALAVLAPPRRGEQRLPQNMTYPTHPLPHRLAIPSRRVFHEAKVLLQAYDIDKVLFGTPWPLGLLGPWFKRYAVIVHGSEILILGGIPGLARWLAKSLAKAEVIFSVSRFTATQVRALLKRYHQQIPRIRILPVPVGKLLGQTIKPNHLTKIRKQLGISPDERVVLHFGRLIPRKGAARLINSWGIISQQFPRSVLIIAGSGRQLPVLKLLAKRQPGRIIFTGAVTDQMAVDLYRLADIFCLAAADRWGGLDTEGLGIVILEASSFGLPVVVGRSGGTAEAVVNGKTGFVIDGKDRNQLVKKISWLLDNRRQAQQMGRTGREWVLRQFNHLAPSTELLKWLDS